MSTHDALRVGRLVLGPVLFLEDDVLVLDPGLFVVGFFWGVLEKREREEKKKKKSEKEEKKKLENKNPKRKKNSKKKKKENAPPGAGRARRSTRPRGTTPWERGRSTGRTSQRGSATRRCRAFGGWKRCFFCFFEKRERERERLANENARGKKKASGTDRPRPRASRFSFDQFEVKNRNDLAPLCAPFLTCERGTRRSASRARCALQTRRSSTRPRRQWSGPRSPGPSASSTVATAPAATRRGRRGPPPSLRRAAMPSHLPSRREPKLR